jgi:hypothetical protein
MTLPLPVMLTLHLLMVKELTDAVAGSCVGSSIDSEQFSEKNWRREMDDCFLCGRNVRS